jgi:hypothetical protein
MFDGSGNFAPMEPRAGGTARLAAAASLLDTIGDWQLAFRAWRRRHPGAVPLLCTLAVLVALWLVYSAWSSSASTTSLLGSDYGNNVIALRQQQQHAPVQLKRYAGVDGRRRAFGDALTRPCTPVPLDELQRGRVPWTRTEVASVADVFRLHIDVMMASENATLAFVTPSMLDFGSSSSSVDIDSPCIVTLRLRGQPFEMINPVLVADVQHATDVEYSAVVRDDVFPDAPPRTVRVPVHMAVRYRTWTAAGTAPVRVLHLDARRHLDGTPCPPARPATAAAAAASDSSSGSDGDAAPCDTPVDVLMMHLALQQLAGTAVVDGASNDAA